MVATLSRLSSGAEGYYLSLTHARYLEQGGEPPGVWVGGTAALLDLSGVVSRDALSNLLDGLSPDGSLPLAENASRSSRTPGIDLCLSPPKEISLYWSLGELNTSEAVRRLHVNAVANTLQFAEDALAQTRRGRGGTTSERSTLLAAKFEHGSSRPAQKSALPDPQLHDHLLIPNIAPRFDGTWGTLDLRPFFRHVTTLGAVYDLSLSYQFEKVFGVEVERKEKGSWGIRRFSKELTREFSKRTQVIEDQLATELLSTSKARKQVTLHTRHYKKPRPRSELFALWKERAQELGFAPTWFSKSRRSAPAHKSEAAAFKEALDIALSQIVSQESHFAYLTLLRHVCQNAHGRGLTSTAVIDRTRSFIDQSPELVKLAERDGEMQYTTREMFEIERRLLASAEGRRSQATTHVLSERVIAKAMKATFTEFAATDEQSAALKHLTLTKGSIKVLTGEAGTGKSKLLAALRTAYDRAGFQVIGGALAARTARGLERESGIQSLTLAKLFTILDHRKPLARIKANLSLKPLLWDITHGRGIRNRRLFESSPLPKRCVFVLDEAGMVGTRDMERLIREVERVKGKLILSGDPDQLQPIAAGLPIAALAKKVGEARLTKIVRQKEDWAKDAARSQRDGKSRDALAAYAERGLLFVGQSTTDAIAKLVSDYQSLPGSLQEKLAVAPTNAEIRRINAQIQKARAADGALGADSVNCNDYTFHKGDRVLFLKNNSVLAITNGDTGEVVSLNARKQVLTIKLDRGQRVTVSLKRYQDLALAYCVSVHKAQGMTVNYATVLAGGSMQDRELSYVQLTRAREKTLIYTNTMVAGDKLSELSRSMSTSRRKRLAHDLMETQER